MYQASGIFAPLTKAEMTELDRRMLDAQLDTIAGSAGRATRADIIDIRRDLNAEWGNR
jgi:hypothetical protein